MDRRLGRTSVLAIALTMALASCETSPSTSAGRDVDPAGRAAAAEGEPEISSERADEIWGSPEVQRVVDLQTEFVRRIDSAQQSGVSLEEIQAAAHVAVDGGDDAELARLLFASREEADGYVASLAEARLAVIEAFPEVAAARDELEPSACTASSKTVDTFFTNFDAIREARLDPREDRAGERTRLPVCGSYWKQLKLLACAGLCSATTAGLATPFCGWGCWCTFCTTNSATADLIC